MPKEQKNNLVPINAAETDYLRCNIPFPSFVDPERIGIDLTKVEGLFKLSGISHLIISGEAGETSKENVVIAGSDSKGTAYAGKAKSTQVALHSSSSYPRCQPQWSGNREVNGSIKVNMSEIERRISSEDRWKEGLRSPDAWIHYLDQICKDGINKIAYTNMLTLDRGDLIWAMLGPATFALAASSTDYSFPISAREPSIPIFLLAFIGFNITGGMLNYIKDKTLDNPARFSLLDAPRFDRAMLFKLKSRHPLIKSLLG